MPALSSATRLLILSVFPLFTSTFARPTPQPQSSDNDGSDSSESGSSGPDYGWQLSNGATIAIGVVVGCVVILGIVMTTLFYLSKKRQWRLRERARGSMKRVGKAIMTPITPKKMTFGPIPDRNGRKIKSSGLGKSEGRRMPSSSPPPPRSDSKQPTSVAERESRTRSISHSRGLSLNTDINSGRPKAPVKSSSKSEKNTKALEMEENPRRKKAPAPLSVGHAVSRAELESKFEMDSPKTPFLTRFVFGRA